MTAIIIPFPDDFNPFEKKENHCSFCGIHKETAGFLVRGSTGYICDSCVKICTKLLKENEDVGPTIA